jgi:hypothetical protein
MTHDREAQGISANLMELVTAGVLAALGLVAIGDSLRIGAGWGADGPKSGYFPFWLGLILFGASAVTFAKAWAARRQRGARPLFVSYPQLRLVGSVMIPTTVFVAAIPFLGLYLPAALLVMWFMMRLGTFTWRSAVPAGLATAVIAFIVFEIWFLVALPKGPVEDLFGF